MLARVAALGGLVLLTMSCGTAAQPPGPLDAQANQTAEAGAPDSGGVDVPLDTGPDTADASADAPAADGVSGEVGPTDGASADDVGADGGGMCSMAGLPYGPFSGCTAPASAAACDLVCQSGCGCGERCTIQGGTLSCRAGGPSFQAVYDACDPKDDRCRPGAICLQESVDNPACGAHCFPHCRGDADCPNARCIIEIQFGTNSTIHKVCSPPLDACNPFGPARCSNIASRPYPTFGCYVMSGSYPDIPICDCAGTTPIGHSCTYEHQCEPGGECVLVGAVRICRRTCKVGLPVNSPLASGGCPATDPTCTAFPGGSQFGYCH